MLHAILSPPPVPPHTPSACHWLLVLFVPELLPSGLYLGLNLPFLGAFVNGEARVGDLMESEGMGGLEGWRGISPWRLSSLPAGT